MLSSQIAMQYFDHIKCICLFFGHFTATMGIVDF